MKIAFVVDDTLDKPDGVQQYILALGAWLGSQGHEVHYLAGASQRTDIAHVHSLSRNVSVRFNGNRLSVPLPAKMPAIRKLLAREQYDILHVQLPYSPMLAHKVIRAAGPQTAVIGTFHIMPHGRIATAGTHLLGRWTASTLRRFDTIFAVSDAARQFAERAFRLHDVQVLPNVVDLGRFQRARPRHDVLAAKVPTVMFVGRLVPRKGCAVLLDAVARVAAEHGDTLPFQVVVCGKGALADALKDQARRLGIADRVRFTGFVSEEDKPGYMASADIAVFPSLGGESFGIVLIEAMAAGRAVVLAGDNPGYRSVLGGRPELLCPPGDAAALAQKITHFLQSQPARDDACAWQAKHVEQFDVAVVGAQLLAAYERCRRLRSVGRS